MTDWGRRCGEGLEGSSTISSFRIPVSFTVTVGRDVENKDLSGVPMTGAKVVVDLLPSRRTGNGLEPLGRVGRFDRRSVRYSAVHFFCELSGFGGSDGAEDKKNFNGEGRKELGVVVTVC